MTRYPSQIRYDQKKPSITFRVYKAEKEAIENMAKKSGKNVSDLVRMALLGLEKDFTETINRVETQGIAKGKKEAENTKYNEGYNKGLQDGTNQWAIWVTCYHCKKPVFIEPNSDAHKEIIEREKGRFHHILPCPP
jgi:flagellar biosynthesis/type III secretory pathway protein FliH